MELNYTGATDFESQRAIHKAYWDYLHKEKAEGKWREIPREEFERHLAENARKRQEKADRDRKEDEERERKERDDQNAPDKAE